MRSSVSCLPPLLCLALLACKEPPTQKAANDTTEDQVNATAKATAKAKAKVKAKMRWLRVEVVVEDYDPVPFFLGIRTGDEVALIDNGEDQVQVEAEVGDNEIHVRFPVFGTELRLMRKGEVWAGEWLASYRFKQDFPLRATRVDAPSPKARFPSSGAPAANMAGQWRVEIKDFGTGRAVFRQDDDGVLSGSLIPPEVGDTRYMSGRVTGNKFAMSTFDGIHAYLLQGSISADGNSLTGVWSWPGINSWTFEATRGDEPSVASLVSAKLRKGETHVTLPELDGYKGQPVLVDFFGTWCPACLDLTPQLVRLNEKYKDQGLVMLSIAIEPPGDGQATERRIADYRERYGITWDIAIRYVEDYTAVIPPEIENALGFPVTIFVRRDQSVAGVHTAFVSDAARPEHQAILERFDEWAQEIVASPPAR